MRRLTYLIFTLFLIQSCQIEDDATPSADDAFIKYYGELTNYEAKDIELISEGSEPTSLIVLGSRLRAAGDRDFYIQRTDLSGNVIDSISFGFNSIIDLDEDGLPDIDVDQSGDTTEADIIRGDDIPGKITVTDNAILMIGTTSITVNLPGRSISDWKQLVFVAFPRDVDFNALDPDNVPILPIAAVRDPQDARSTELDLIGNDIIALQDGGLLLVGSKEFDRGSSTDFDSYFLKLQLRTDRSSIAFEDVLGVEGADEDEEVIRAFEKENGNIVLIGSGNTNSALGENQSNNGRNAFFIEVDPNGTPVNPIYYGVDNPDDDAVYNEFVTNAIEVPSGYIIVGTSETSQGESFGFAMSLNEDGGDNSVARLPSSEFTDLETRINGVTQSRDNGLVLVGQYPSFVSGEEVKSGEALFMKVDESLNPLLGNEANFGLTAGNDAFVDAVTLPDGSIVVVGNFEFGTSTKLISIIKLNDTGNLED